MARRGRKLFTIGYEGASQTELVAALQAAGVRTLVDVRELPNSRRKGFSKKALSAALAEAGIAYQHARALGSPRPLRHRLRKDADLPAFFRDFRKYLSGQRPVLDHLAHALTGNSVLLCYERDYRKCHRSVVAAQLGKRLSCSPKHLTIGV